MLKPIHLFLTFLIITCAILFAPTAMASPVYQSGSASYYGKAHHGKRTASGKRFNMHAMTAAHRTLPFGTKLKITSKDTGKSVIVTVNDRGPYHGRRILDLSQEAARQLGIIKVGVGQVTIVKMGKENHATPSRLNVEVNLPYIIQDQHDPLGHLIAGLKI